MTKFNKSIKTFRVGGLELFQHFDKNLALKEDLKKIKKHPSEQYMDPPFPQVGEETPLSVIASLLHYNPAVIITKRDKTAGIVTKADLMKAV